MRAETDPAAGFAELGDRLGLVAEDRAGVASAARRWLAESDRRWLLVLDNAPDAGVVSEWVPTTGRGRVIVTSRSVGLGDVAGVVKVDVFDPDIATGFLLERTGSDDAVGAGAVAVALGGLPLALAHAAGVCRAGTGFDVYLGLLEGLPAAEMFDRAPGAAYEATVAATFEPSVREAETRAPGARGLLQVAACLAPDRIPRVLLVPEGGDPTETKAATDALGALVDLSLLAVSGDGLFDLHRLLAKVVRDADPAATAAAAVAALGAICDVWPIDTGPTGTWPLCETLLPHLETVATHLDFPGDHNQALIDALNTTSSWLHRAAPGPVDHTTRTLQQAERLLGVDHPDTITARNNLANSYQTAGRNSEAIPIREGVVADRERLLGVDHPDTISARNNLANSYQTAGRTGEAITIQEGVVADFERLLGGDHRDTIRSRQALEAWRRHPPG